VLVSQLHTCHSLGSGDIPESEQAHILALKEGLTPDQRNIYFGHYPSSVVRQSQVGNSCKKNTFQTLYSFLCSVVMKISSPCFCENGKFHGFFGACE
jgi:hypothetical protein